MGSSRFSKPCCAAAEGLGLKGGDLALPAFAIGRLSEPSAALVSPSRRLTGSGGGPGPDRTGCMASCWHNWLSSARSVSRVLKIARSSPAEERLRGQSANPRCIYSIHSAADAFRPVILLCGQAVPVQALSRHTCHGLSLLLRNSCIFMIEHGDQILTAFLDQVGLRLACTAAAAAAAAAQPCISIFGQIRITLCGHEFDGHCSHC